MKKRTDASQTWSEDLHCTEVEAEVLAAYTMGFSPEETEENNYKVLLWTSDVLADLSETLSIGRLVVVEYLLWAGFKLENDKGGHPSWVMWCNKDRYEEPFYDR